MSRENKGNRRGNNPLFFQLNLALPLEHVAAKLHDFAENNMLQGINLARVLFAEVRSPRRNAR
jgi:hypothetical protein